VARFDFLTAQTRQDAENTKRCPQISPIAQINNGFDKVLAYDHFSLWLGRFLVLVESVKSA
jgi:hypothetical protein